MVGFEGMDCVQLKPEQTKLVNMTIVISFCFCALSLFLFPTHAFSQVVFSDDFDAGPAACSTLAPNWTTTDANLSDIDTSTANSNSCSLFTRGDIVSTTTIPIDLSGASGADFEAWVRKGDDAFSEDPDAAAENLVLEFRDALGAWFTLSSFDAVALADGAITNVNIPLPAAALHGAVQFRFRQLGGSGGPPNNGGLGFDFWHVDDVVVTATATPPTPPTLTANSCDDFEQGTLNNWFATDTTRIGINTDTANSPTNSLFLRHGTATATSVAVNATGLSEITVWVRRGDDTFSENPDPGEDLTIEFLDNALVWTPLETFTGSGTQGEIFNRTYPATAAMRHSNFRIRITLAAGNGVDFDYWHVDDVCFVSGMTDLNVVKSLSVESDPVGTGADPYAIPGAFIRYTIDVSNAGAGVVDNDTIVLEDTLDQNIALFVGDLDGSGSPFIFTDGTGANASGISLDFGSLADGTDGVIFRDASNNIITPTAPFDDDVASFELTFDGSMNGTGAGGTPAFSIEYRVRVD